MTKVVPGDLSVSAPARMVASGTGTAFDGTYLLPVVLVDPSTGAGVAPGSSFTSLSLADGSDAAEGAIADAVVQGDVTGTVSAKLRGLNKVLGTVADVAWASGSGSAIALLKAIASHLPAQGQAVMAASLPVVVASDQSAVPTTSTDTDHYYQTHDFTTTGVGPTLDLTAANALVYSLQVTADGTVTSFTVAVEGSLDGLNWGTTHPLLTFSSASLSLGDVASATAKPLKYVRVDVTALTLNTATKITTQLLALR